jgi:hypothetical protein
LEEALQKLTGQATQILTKGKFELRGWENMNTFLTPLERENKPSPVFGQLRDKV